MENQYKGYDNIFSVTLRGLMEKHPQTGEKTTQKTLGEAIGVRPQTVSLYLDGSTQPNADNLYKIARYFDVSVDYLLSGVSSENKEIHKVLGLSEEAVRMIKLAHDTDRSDSCIEVLPLLDELLANVDFYRFLEDLALKVDNLTRLMNQTPEERAMRPPGLNIEGYWSWDLNTYVQEFVRMELKKRGIDLWQA
jgi:transcriptional regulator with XRE-family HTH domain